MNIHDTPDVAQAVNLSDLYAGLARANIGPGWNKPEPSMYPTPKKTFVPAHWSYRVAKGALDAAGRLIGTDQAERRNLILYNPIPGNTYATVRTIVAAYQMIKGFETARSHRHTANAMRFILESGPKAYTVVANAKVPMEPGDVLLTPNWAWHGHSNDGGDCAYWIDFLDAPLTHLLGPMFFEQYEEAFVQKTETIAAVSPYRFQFAEWGAKAKQQPELQPGLREVIIGPPYLDTVRLKWRHLSAGTKLQECETTANCVYAVQQGSGAIECDGVSFAWARGDVFAVPSWHKARWDVREESYLLRISDENLLEKLNWLHSSEPGSLMGDVERRRRASF